MLFTLHDVAGVESVLSGAANTFTGDWAASRALARRRDCSVTSGCPATCRIKNGGIPLHSATGVTAEKPICLLALLTDLRGASTVTSQMLIIVDWSHSLLAAASPDNGEPILPCRCVSTEVFSPEAALRWAARYKGVHGHRFVILLGNRWDSQHARVIQQQCQHRQMPL